MGRVKLQLDREGSALMYPITDALKEKFNSENPQNIRITLNPESDAVVFTNEDVVKGSLYVNRACTASNSLELGSVVSAEFGCILFNDNYDDVIFEGAELFVEVGIDDTYIPMGYYTIDETPKVRDTISIVALDRMMFFDAEVTDTTIKGENRTIRQYIDRMCTVCGITLATNIASYPNVSYVVPEYPDDVGVTYRQLLSWCCQIMGKNAYIDWEGNLRIEFPSVHTLDEASDTSWISDENSETERFTSDLENYEVTTTGVVFTDSEGTVHVNGSNTYAFDLSGNLLIQDTSIIANIDVSGIVYTPFSATVVPCPYLFPMDYILFVKNSTNYIGLLTSVTYRMNGHCELASVGESVTQRSYSRQTQVSTATRMVIERKVAELNTAIDNAMDEAVLNASQLIKSSLSGYVVLNDTNDDGHPDELLIMDTSDISTATKVWRWNQNGLGYSSTGYNGTYALAMTANGQIVADFITTGYMSADHIQGGTLTLGGANDTNGVLQVLDSSGNVNCEIDNDGIETTGVIDDNAGYDFYGKTKLTSGQIAFYYEDDSGAWINYGSICHSHAKSNGVDFARLVINSKNGLSIDVSDDMKISFDSTSNHSSSEINVTENEVLLNIEGYPTNYYPADYGSVSVRQGSVVISASEIPSQSVSYPIKATFDKNGLTLTDNTNSITITPTSNVAELQYTVISTF